MHEWLVHPVVRGTVTGFLTAVVADLISFRKFHSWGELRQNFNFSVASYAWFMGALTGFLTSAGYDAVVS